MSAPSLDRDDMTARLEILESRLRGFEQRDRWLKRMGAAMLAVAGVFALLGPTPVGKADEPKKKIVEADEFVVRGADGKVRAKMNDGGLVLNDTAGEARVSLFNNNEDGSRGLLVFSANDQKQQLMVLRTKEGLLSFGINDPNGKTRVMLTTDAKGKPYLLLQNEAGVPFFSQTQP